MVNNSLCFSYYFEAKLINELRSQDKENYDELIDLLIRINGINQQYFSKFSLPEH